MSALPFLPSEPDLAAMREAAQRCRGCDLYRDSTQAVFGEGPETARVMLVGEQPGDQEDRQGHPFVGPAGRLLDEALAEAGIDRSLVYLTNAVKHFKWKQVGRKRLHQKPAYKEVQACHPWVRAEIEVVRPEVLVLLGATAAQALLGKDFRVTQRRGEWVESPLASHVMATVHPSSILRAPDAETRHAEKERFIEDLRKVSTVL